VVLTFIDLYLTIEAETVVANSWLALSGVLKAEAAIALTLRGVLTAATKFQGAVT
jgi:hypothetical protein